MKFFRIYETWLKETDGLTLEEKGRLIDCLVDYLLTGRNYVQELLNGGKTPLKGNERYYYPSFIDRIRRENETHDRHKAERAEARRK